MSFFGLGKKPETEREKKIKEFRLAFPTSRRPHNDDSTIEVLFLVNKEYNTLRIFITADFPQSKPVFQVIGPLSHPLLDNFKRVVGCRQVNEWTRDSSLAQVVKDCISQLQSTDPQPPTTSSPGPSPSQANSPDSSQSSSMSTVTQTQGNNTVHTVHTAYSYNNPPQITSNASSSSSSSYQMQQLHQDFPTTYAYPAQPIQQVVHGNVYASSASYAGGAYDMSSSNANRRQSSTPTSPPPSYAHANAHSSQYVPSNTTSNVIMGSISTSNTNGYMQQQRRPSGNVVEETTQIVRTPIPPIPNQFQELENMSIEQLEKILNEEISLETHISSMESVKSMTTLRDQLRDSNRESAEESLVQEESLSTAHAEVSELQARIRVEVTKYQELFDEASKKFAKSSEDMLREVNVKRDAIDVESEAISTAFKKGEIDLSTFSEDFLKARKSYHTICNKLGKLASM